MVSCLRYRRTVLNLIAQSSVVLLFVTLLFLFVFKQTTHPLHAQSINPSNSEDTAQASFIFTVTVATAGADSSLLDDEDCTTTDTITIFRAQQVVYCYRVQNTSNVTFTRHSLSNSLDGIIFANDEFAVAPQGTTSLTQDSKVIWLDQAIKFSTKTVPSSTVIQSTWTAFPEQGESIAQIDSVTVNVLQPALTLTHTVGLDPNACGSTNSVTALPSGSAAHCLQIVNTGQVTFTQLTINVQGINVQSTIPYTLTPGALLKIDETNRAALGIEQTFILSNITDEGNYASSVTATTALGDSEPANAAATINVFTRNYAVDLKISDQRNTCPSTNVAPLQNSNYFLCIVLHNSSNVTFTDHTITLRPENRTFHFTYELGPSRELSITNDVLTNQLKQQPILGPFTYTNNLDQGVTVTSTHPLGYIANESTQLTIAQATPTPTDTPTITRTPTPRTPVPPTQTWTRTPAPTGTPTDTPSPTFTVPPTPTPITPVPTPTLSFAVSILATPTSPQDVFATQTQVAVEQTAQAAQFQPPTLDPVFLQQTEQAIFVQQTEQAIFATQTYEALVSSGQIPPTVDPNAQAVPLVDPNAQPAPLAEATDLQPALAAPMQQEEPLATDTIEPSPTETATETGTPEPTIRPIIPPTPAPSLDSFALFATVAGRMVAVASWVWLLLGTLFFLVAAITMMGLALRTIGFSRGDDYFDLVESDDPEQDEIVTVSTPPTQSTSENWPESLP